MLAHDRDLTIGKYRQSRPNFFSFFFFEIRTLWRNGSARWASCECMSASESSNNVEHFCATDHLEECGAHEFTCTNRMCISSDFVCDSHNDCKDSSDELNCGTENPCDSFTLNVLYISNHDASSPLTSLKWSCLLILIFTLSTQNDALLWCHKIGLFVFYTVRRSILQFVIHTSTSAAMATVCRCRWGVTSCLTAATRQTKLTVVNIPAQRDTAISY